ncbi:MAG: sodium-dependent transporter [Coriobacteriia bacterium]|nr:sodium-dependent transporter [Coriobacteriia bacterium]
MSTTKHHVGFATRWGFILAAVGSAVGMANVWGFPYRMATYGGGAFLLIYIFFVVVFGSLALPAEFAIGRRARTGTLGAYELAWASRKPSLRPVGKAIGWLPLAGSLCIAIGYAVIVAYVLKALFDSLFGTLLTVDTQMWFESFAMTPTSVVPFHVTIVLVTLLTLFLGAKSIERTNRILMPVFFIIFAIFAIRVAFLPGVLDGYLFMFTPRWEALVNPETWIFAMGQAFFSLSVTGSGMIVYGAYLSKDEDVVAVARRTALFDTIAATVAALTIIPAVFAYGLDISSGPGLLFVTLPAILQDIPFGQLFAIILYVAMIAAGVSSLQNMFEVVGESLLYRFKFLKRWIVLVLIAVVVLGVGLNMEAIFQWGPWMDWVSIYIIPLGATIGAISWFFVMKKEDLLEEINLAAVKKHGDLWYNCGRYLYVPFALLLCIIALAMQVAF